MPVDPALMLSKAGYWVSLFWNLWVGTLVQVNLDASWDLPWVSFVELQSDAVCGCLYWALASMGRIKLHTRLASLSTEFGGRLAIGPRHHDIHLYLSPPACCLLVSVTEGASGSTRVAWYKFPWTHQVGMSCVYQTDTGSNLVTVLGLKPLSKWPRVYQVYLLHTRCPWTFVVSWVLQELLGWDQQRLSGPNSPRPGLVKGSLCTSQVCEGKLYIVPRAICIPDSSGSLCSAGWGLWDSWGWG